MIFIDIASTQLSASEKTCLQHKLVSGVTLFARNCESVEQVAALTTEIKRVNPNIAIAIDQEGGRVQRIKDKLTLLPSMHVFGKLYDADPKLACEKIKDHGWLIGAELAALGIDIDFAPVLDIHMGISSIIGDRALHRDPKIISELARAYIAGLSSAGILSVSKHFPGHGCVELDSHIDIPVDHRDFDQIWQQDLVPYRELNRELDVSAIMMSHVIYPEISQAPAGFCKIWIRQILREKLDFKGLVFTDDLTMKAAHYAGDMHKRVVMALTTGCDVALVCNHKEDMFKLLAGLAEDEALQELMARQEPKRLSLFCKKTEPVASLPELQKMKHYLATRDFISKLQG